ncbi:hypothetical protein I7I51_07637 [Histoplasma capsulatum]|uniref:Myb-like domain-containing protein n=1 Tax=Ajellomyces capsulatus TaxID=5037 RepID=A0A8A1M0L9_AJECA|nr:hypothetical protein I7I51_07637 [Histoplasma capsulatum]
MEFINYTPSQPERKTFQAHPDHFRPPCSTLTTLPLKPLRPSHPLSLFPFCLPGRPNVVNPPPYSTSVSLQTQPMHSVSLKPHPLPSCPPSSFPPCTPLQGSRSGQDPAQVIVLNDFDKVFIKNGIAEGLESKSFVDLTTDITSCGDIITLDSRPHPYGARHDPIDFQKRNEDRCQEKTNEASPSLELFVGSITTQSALLAEPLTSNGKSNPLPASEKQPHLLELNREQDETLNQESPHGSQETEISSKSSTTAQGGSASSDENENADSTSAMLVAHSVKLDQQKGKTDACNTGKCQSPFTGRYRRSDVGSMESMESMVAVVIPSISHRHREDPEKIKGNESAQHDPGTHQRNTRSKSKCKILIEDRHLTGSPAQPTDDNWGEWDITGTTDLSDDSDGDYTASSDGDDLVKQQSKRRKISSRSAATTSCRPQSRSRGARVVGHHREVKRAPRSGRSVAATEHSISSTRVDHEWCTRCGPVAPAGGSEHTFSPRLLSPEDISALVSAFAQRLLDLRKDPSTDAERAMDGGVADIDTESVDKDPRTAELDRKRSRWTQGEDERLKDLKTRGWRWWEIKQQFPHRKLSALQQRWSSKLRERGASPMTDTRKRKRKCKPIIVTIP